MSLVYNPLIHDINSSNSIDSCLVNSFTTILQESYLSEENVKALDVIEKIITTYSNEENKTSTSLFCNILYFKNYKFDDEIIVNKQKEYCNPQKIYYDEKKYTLLKFIDFHFYNLEQGLNKYQKEQLKNITFKEIFQHKESKFMLHTNHNSVLRVHYGNKSEIFDKNYNGLTFLKYQVIQKFNLNLYPYEIEFVDANNNAVIPKNYEDWKLITQVYVNRSQESTKEDLDNKLSTHGCIKIQDPNSAALLLHIKYDQTIKELKTQIYERSGILPKNQNLTYFNRELEDVYMLKDYKIFDQRTIFVSSDIDINSSQYKTYLEGPIYVKDLVGRTLTYIVNFDITIIELKQQISDKINIPVDDQRLIYDGKQLENDKSLRYYGVDREKTLHLVLRLRGGMSHEISSRKGEAINVMKIKNHSSSTSFEIKVKLDKPLLELKKKINRKQGIPIELQRIIFNGKELMDHKTPRKYRLHQSQMLHLAVAKSQAPTTIIEKVKKIQISAIEIKKLDSDETMKLFLSTGRHTCKEIVDLLVSGKAVKAN